MIVMTKPVWYDNPEGMTEPYHPFGVRYTLDLSTKIVLPLQGWKQDQPEARAILHSTKPQFMTLQGIKMPCRCVSYAGKDNVSPSS